MSVVEIPKLTHSGVYEGRLFHTLRRMTLPFYPFTLRGKAYLESPWKGIFDKSVATVSLPPALVAIGLAALLMKLESPRLPVFIIQTRHGGDNGPFPMLKIRSQSKSTEDTGEIRPTVVGAILRRASIDEMPQLLNVLRGEMSIVGIRPLPEQALRQLEDWMLIHLPYRLARSRFGFTDEEWREGKLAPELIREVREFADEVRKVTKKEWGEFENYNPGKPGLTGLYQIFGRRELNGRQRIKLESFYRKNASLGLDIAILLATATAVISRRGAR